MRRKLKLLVVMLCVAILTLGGTARAAGELCGMTATADVVDVSVVLVARQHRDIVVTSDRSDLRRLDPGAVILAV